MSQCTVEGCSKPRRRERSGLCGMHDARKRKHGDVHFSYKSPDEIAKRFWAEVDKTPGHGPQGECWLFIGLLDEDGYGRTGLSRKYERRSHRFAFRLVKGEIPQGLGVLHSCDVRSCVNPSHLRVGTNQDNTRDRVIRGRDRKGSEKANARLDEMIVADIRRRVRGGERKAPIARELGVSEATIQHAVEGRTWKHVNI